MRALLTRAKADNGTFSCCHSEPRTIDRSNDSILTSLGEVSFRPTWNVSRPLTPSEQDHGEGDAESLAFDLDLQQLTVKGIEVNDREATFTTNDGAVMGDEPNATSSRFVIILEHDAQPSDGVLEQEDRDTVCGGLSGDRGSGDAAGAVAGRRFCRGPLAWRWRRWAWSPPMILPAPRGRAGAFW